jgi:siroheme synthase-like protein
MAEPPRRDARGGAPGAGANFYPVSLDVAGRACLVVGGGAVAARKARGLLACGAAVLVVAPALGADMEALVPQLRAVERRAYRRGDAAGCRLVVTATGDPAVDGAVHADADKSGIWVNSADDPAHCSFILPAVHRDGPVTIAVSTGGQSPALASWLRDRLAEDSGRGAGALAELLGAARTRLKEAGLPTDGVDWAGLLDGPLPGLVRAGDIDNARAIIDSAAGQ